MKIFFKRKECILLMAVLFLPAQVTADTYRIKVTPGLSIEESYDDNIYLDKTDKESDFITMISPRFSLDTQFEKKHLEISYFPTIVRYKEEDGNNTVRHSGTLTYGQDISQHLRLDLTDTYLRSEDPLEETEGVETVRRTRRTYQRNNGRGSLRYLFGPENELIAGYAHSMQKNEEERIDGGETHNPFANLTYWFNEKNGMGLDYQYTKAEFWREHDLEGEDDHTGHSAGVSYNYRFNMHTTGTVRYDFTNRQFEEPSEDYRVHEGSVGFEQAISPDLSLSLRTGYFIQEMERSEGTSGPIFDAALVKKLEQGSFTIGGQAGWDEAYLDVERRGFSRYWTLDSRLQYQLLEYVNSYVGGSYRRDKDEDGKEWEIWTGNCGLAWTLLRDVSLSLDYTYSESKEEYTTWRGGCGLRWAFLRWFSLSANYTFAERDDEDDESDYNVNRVMLVLTGNRLFEW